MADDRYSRVQRPGEFRRETPPDDQPVDPLMELARLIGQADPFADLPRQRAARPTPRIADPSTWPERPSDDTPAHDPRGHHVGAYDDHPQDHRDDYEPGHGGYGYDPHGYSSAAEPEPTADLHVEPEALDTWRPNDPYHHTEGMFPREPQVFTDSAPPAYEPPAPQPVVRAEPRWVPPRPSGASVFDPDDPLGFEREAAAGVYGGAGSHYETGGLPAASHAPAHVPPTAGIAADRVRTIVDRDRGFADHPAGFPAVSSVSADPGRALHPDAYLSRPSAAGHAAPMGEDPYAAEDLAAHYAAAGRARPRRSRAVIVAAAAFVLVFVGAAGAFGYRLLFSGESRPAPVIRADQTPAKVVPAPAGDAAKPINDRLNDQASLEKIISREEQPVEIRDASRPPTPRMVFPNQTAGINPNAPTGSAVAPPPPPTPFAAAAAPVTGGEPPKKIRTVTIRSDQGTDSATRSVPARGPAPAPADGAGPLSLSPVTTPSAPRLAAVPPAPPQAAPATGGYVVQISAQKTEAEAQASFRILSGRYPGQLSGRSPIIRRKDTASGSMYAAQVGPFGARAEAVQLCEDLKAAGGSCFVQKN